jgi:putative SOS response-associated peptidase YedK
MCYFVEHNIQRKELEKRFKVKFPEDPRYTPSFFQSAFNKPYMPAINGSAANEVQMFQWGLIPHWSKDEIGAEKNRLSTFNARAETIHEKPSFRKAVQTGRCLISAHGFFEFQSTPELKIPYYILLKNNEIFAFAGIFDTWTNPVTGEIIHSFSIITTSANPMMEKIHNTKKRMPVILPKDRELEWVSPNLSIESVSSFLKPYPEEEMEAYTVSRKIVEKNINPFDSTLIDKVEHEQGYRLF